MSGTQTFTIPGRLEGTNEIARADRAGAHVGARIRKKSIAYVHSVINAQRPRLQPCEAFPVAVHLDCYENSKKRDIDNIAFGAMKVILDALVHADILPDDSPRYVTRVSAQHHCEPQNPRIEVTITTIGGTNDRA